MQWRSRIGTFTQPVCKHLKMAGIRVSKQTVTLTLRALLGCGLLLIISGDVESNPGPTGGDKQPRSVQTLQTTLTQNTGGQVVSNDGSSTINSELSDIKVQLHDLSKQMTDLQTKVNNLTKENKELKQKCEKLESQSRRENLIFHGINEEPKETWNDTEKKVRTVLKEKLNIDNAEDQEAVSIERAHRLPTKDRNKPRPIIFLLQN